MATPRRIRRNEHFDALNEIDRLFRRQFQTARAENNEEFDTSTTLRWTIPASGGLSYMLILTMDANSILVRGGTGSRWTDINWNKCLREKIDIGRMKPLLIPQEGTDAAIRMFRKLRLGHCRRQNLETLLAA